MSLLTVPQSQNHHITPPFEKVCAPAHNKSQTGHTPGIWTDAYQIWLCHTINHTLVTYLDSERTNINIWLCHTTNHTLVTYLDSGRTNISIWLCHTTNHTPVTNLDSYRYMTLSCRYSTKTQHKWHQYLRY